MERRHDSTLWHGQSNADQLLISNNMAMVSLQDVVAMEQWTNVCLSESLRESSNIKVSLCFHSGD